MSLESRIAVNSDVYDMENGQSMNVAQTMNVAGTQGSLIMNTLDQRDLSNDVMARRLKNRERQRRYRARKRLEADMKKSSVLNHSTTPQGDLQPNGSLSNGVGRVYCKRDWKKDARRATKSRDQECALNGFVKPFTLTTKSQSIFPSENKAVAQAPVEWESGPSLSLVNFERNEAKVGRRDWKADARKMKS